MTDYSTTPALHSTSHFSGEHLENVSLPTHQVTPKRKETKEENILGVVYTHRFTHFNVLWIDDNTVTNIRPLLIHKC